jgi:hypothetical protein
MEARPEVIFTNSKEPGGHTEHKSNRSKWRHIDKDCIKKKLHKKTKVSKTDIVAINIKATEKLS